MDIRTQATKAYRREHPESRAVSPFRYVVNTSRRRRRGCIFCGAEGPGWCGQWPRTVSSQRWESEHLCPTMVQYAEGSTR